MLFITRMTAIPALCTSMPLFCRNAKNGGHWKNRLLLHFRPKLSTKGQHVLQRETYTGKSYCDACLWFHFFPLCETSWKAHLQRLGADIWETSQKLLRPQKSLEVQPCRGSATSGALRLKSRDFVDFKMELSDASSHWKEIRESSNILMMLSCRVSVWSVVTSAVFINTFR